MNQAFCQANVFVAIKVSKDRANIKRILKRFGVDADDLAGNNINFQIVNRDLEEIQEELIVPLGAFLDPERRSSFFYRGRDGRISTILIEDGNLKCA
jgi:hypothetical protein